MCREFQAFNKHRVANLSSQQTKNDCVAFFEKSILKWSRLRELFYEIPQEQYKLYEHVSRQSLQQEADEIINWFQDNYLKNKKFSNFQLNRTLSNGKTQEIDSVFSIIFYGANIERILSTSRAYSDDIESGLAQLRGRLASVKELQISKFDQETKEIPLLRIRNTLGKFNLFADQLKRVRSGKEPFLIKDEYDIQNLVHALLLLDFEDVRKEDPTPISSGASSKIDLVLKTENVLVEIKKATSSLRERNWKSAYRGHFKVQGLSKCKNLDLLRV